MLPFLFNEVFDCNLDLRIESAGIAGVPAVVLDNFLRHPERAREVVGASAATNWKHVEGGRNFIDYRDCRVRFPVFIPCPLLGLAQQAIQAVYGVTTMPQDPHVDVNWFQQLAPRRQDYAVPHHDVINAGRRSFTCIVYLNAPHECSGGTAFFRSKATGGLARDAAFERLVAASPELVETGRDYWLESGPRHWEYLGAVPMVAGRLMIFPSEFFHAAWHPVDSFDTFPRLTLAFWMVL